MMSATFLCEPGEFHYCAIAFDSEFRQLGITDGTLIASIPCAASTLLNIARNRAASEFKTDGARVSITSFTRIAP